MKETYNHDVDSKAENKSLDSKENGEQWWKWKDLTARVNQTLEKEKQLRKKELNEIAWEEFLAIAQTKNFEDCSIGEDSILWNFLQIEWHKIFKLDGIEWWINYYVSDEDITCVNESLNNWIMFFKAGGRYIWEIKRWLPNWEWTHIMKDWNKLEWKRENGIMSWEGVYTWKNWSILSSNDWNEDGPKNWKIKINIERIDHDFDAVRNNNESNREITTEWDYKGRLIDRKTWNLIN